ncbi:hypothetical protein [Catenovulum sediminis]|uniref:hypothetical protein n=1 Tax=Catenovulum sediminis TaxID=1740262 RepID=UPI00117C61EF|nr:hypothetical protein [Catenovulum sediminis]
MKKFKAIFLVFIGVCIAVLLYQLWPQPPEFNEPDAAQRAPANLENQQHSANKPAIHASFNADSSTADSSNQFSTEKNAGETAEQQAQLAARKEQVAVKQAEIEILMAELDENLKNKAKKQQIEQQINQKLAEYNQLVLPIALQQMQDKNKQAQ